MPADDCLSTNQFFFQIKNSHLLPLDGVAVFITPHSTKRWMDQHNEDTVILRVLPLVGLKTVATVLRDKGTCHPVHQCGSLMYF